MPFAERWNRYWFGEASLVRLGAFRIAILVLALWDLGWYLNAVVLRDAALITAGGPTREWRPIAVFEILGIGPIGLEAATWLTWATLIALVLGIAGLMTRAMCIVVALLSFYATGLAYSFGKPHHDKVALTFALLALPLAPVGARLSLDALLTRTIRRARGEDTALLEAASFARLPLALTRWTIAIGYFFAGASKLLLGGTAWLNGYTLQGIMMGHDNEWSAFMSQSVLLCQLMSAGLVLGQLTFPVVLFVPWTRWIYLPLMVFMHLMTWKTMDTGPYMQLWGTLVCFLPLEHVPAAVRASVTRGPPLRRALAAAGVVVILVIVARVLLFINLPHWLRFVTGAT